MAEEQVTLQQFFEQLLPTGFAAQREAGNAVPQDFTMQYLVSGDGNWKARWTEPAQGGPADGHWELFDILQDRGETNDVSAQNSTVVSALFGNWQTYMTSVGGVEPLRPAGYY